jgi:D-alanine transaminase
MEFEMSRTVYVNGEFVPENEARVSIFDRGFLFADGVYEVTAVIKGKLVDYPMHMERLKRSLGEMDMSSPLDDDALLAMHRELAKRNNLEEGGIYMQITRGAADRDFTRPENVTSSLVAFTQANNLLNAPGAVTGERAIIVPDIRWARRDIKTIALLPQTMAKQAAKDAGVSKAWMVGEDGYITEESSASTYIVKGNVLITRPVSNAILAGITRKAVLALLQQTDVTLDERMFTPEDTYGADEALVTSASSFVMPIIEIDGKTIGTGRPGPVTNRLRELYIEAALKDSI